MDIKNFNLDHLLESIEKTAQGSVAHLQERAHEIKKDVAAGLETLATLKNDALAGFLERAAAVFVVDTHAAHGVEEDGSVLLHHVSLELNSMRVHLDPGRPSRHSRVPLGKRLRVVLLLVPLDD